MSRRPRASQSSVLPLQPRASHSSGLPPAGILGQWRESGVLKPWLYHKLAALLQEKHNLMGAQFPNL